MQSEVNIGLLGHVDHGKTTLVSSITGKWTDTYSEELKRGISIKIGYATFNTYKCPNGHYSTKKGKCKICKKEMKIDRRISFLDAPGHEALMTTAIAASTLMDGVLLLIAANERCPMPQTKEHLKVIELLGIKNIIIVQTKLDLVSKERAIEHYKEIKRFVKGTIAENAPIIPVSAIQKINIDKLLEAMAKYIPTPKRDAKLPARFFTIRSFDVNKPGARPSELVGGVIGGSVAQGEIRVGDELEIRGMIDKPIKFKVKSLAEENNKLKKAKPGGLIAIGTDLDPWLTKRDGLAGTLIGKPEALPEERKEITIKYELIEREDFQTKGFARDEPIVVSINTAVTIGYVRETKKGKARIELKKKICADDGTIVAISRKIGQRWRLAAFGKII